MRIITQNSYFSYHFSFKGFSPRPTPEALPLEPTGSPPDFRYRLALRTCHDGPLHFQILSTVYAQLKQRDQPPLKTSA